MSEESTYLKEKDGPGGPAGIPDGPHHKGPGGPAGIPDGPHHKGPDGPGGPAGIPDGPHHGGPNGGPDGGPHGHKGGPDGGPNGHGHHHHHTDGSTPPADMRGGHDDCPASEGLVATLELQNIATFNLNTDFVILSKEIFTALESVEGDGFSVEDEFAVIGEGDGTADTTESVFVYDARDMTLYYDTNGTDDGFGDGGEIFKIDEIVPVDPGAVLGVSDFFVINMLG